MPAPPVAGQSLARPSSLILLIGAVAAAKAAAITKDGRSPPRSAIRPVALTQRKAGVVFPSQAAAVFSAWRDGEIARSVPRWTARAPDAGRCVAALPRRARLALGRNGQWPRPRLHAIPTDAEMDPSPTIAAVIFRAFTGRRLLQHPMDSRFMSIPRLPDGVQRSHPSHGGQRERRIASRDDRFRETPARGVLVSGKGAGRALAGVFRFLNGCVSASEQSCYGNGMPRGPGCLPAVTTAVS